MWSWLHVNVGSVGGIGKMGTMESLTIGELARHSGVPITTLRYYDRVGLVRSERSHNNRRRYPPATLELLRLIQLCRAVGCTLTEVSDVVGGGADARKAIALRRLVDVDHHIAELTAARAVLSHFAECQHTASTADECRRVTARALRSVNPDKSTQNRAATARQARG